MAEITYNDLLGQLNGMEKDQFEGVGFGSSGFLDNYQNNPNSLSVTGHDNFKKFEPIAKAYQASETIPKGNFVSNMFNFGSADAAMPDKTYGLQDSMMGMSINPNGSLNYNNQSPNLGFRSMVDMANNVNNFDSQFSYPNRELVATNIASAPQVKGMSYEQMVDLGLAGPDQDVGMTAEDLQNRPSFFGNIKNQIGQGIGSLKDFAIDKGRMGRNLIGSAGAMALGLPGIVGSGAMTLLSGLGNMFEDRQISGDGTIMDEFGRSYTADELNKQNALGGYYTDAARSSRRRTSRIAKMLERQKLGKKISAKNLAKLQAQEAAQEAARQAATTQMAAANKAAGRGGYQAGYGGDFMDGPSDAGRGNAPSDKGGSDSMGSFRDGGLASMFTRRG